MKICWFSDLDLVGSGYLNLSVPLCEGLSKRGHEVKVSGLGYRGTQHDYNFSIIPAGNVGDGMGIIQNLYNLWHFDALVVALDIPLQLRIIQMMQNRPFKYVGIMPVEADPLSLTWAMGLMQMDKRLIISEFGKNECEKMGVSAEHIQVGLDTEAWRFPTPEEKRKVRKDLLGVEDDVFIILTVADNQERKNLSTGMKIVSEFIYGHPTTKYVIVTREHNAVGWLLRDYAQKLGISSNVMIFERGMDFKKLWSLYAASDLFFLPSKAEGLGLPLLEAMAVGLPCVGTNCTGIAELLADDRGLLADYVHIFPDYSYVDPFGNGHRYFIDPKDGVAKLAEAHSKSQTKRINKARKYVETLKWDIAVEQLEKSLLELNQ